MHSSVSSAVRRRLVFLIIVLDFVFVNGAKTRYLGSKTTSKTLLELGDEVLHNDADLESALRDLTVEAEPLPESRVFRPLDLDQMFSLAGRRPGFSRTIMARRYPGDAARLALQHPPDRLDVSTEPRGNFQIKIRCRTPATSSSFSSSASSSTSYATKYQLPLDDDKQVHRKSNSLLRGGGVKEVDVSPARVRYLRRRQVEPCYSSSSSFSSPSSIKPSSGQAMMGNARNGKTAAASQIVLTRLLSVWPHYSAPRSSNDDLLLVGWRHQVTTMGSSRSSSSLKDDDIELQRKRNCGTKYKKDCLLRRVSPRKTSTVDPMLMMVGIGKK